MLTMFDMDEYVYAALRAGASGFLLKDVPPGRCWLLVSVPCTRASPLLAPTLTRRMIEIYLNTHRVRDAEARGRLATLTAREDDVLRLLAKGLTNAEIVAKLYVSETTVKTHVGRVLMEAGST